MKILMYPFRLGIQELKKDNAFRKTIQSKAVKSTILTFMGQTFLFLVAMLIMYIILLYIIVVTFLDPLSFIAFPVMFIMLLIFISIYKNIIPKPKRSFLKHKNVYGQYVEVTKHIE